MHDRAWRARSFGCGRRAWRRWRSRLGRVRRRVWDSLLRCSRGRTSRRWLGAADRRAHIGQIDEPETKPRCRRKARWQNDRAALQPRCASGRPCEHKAPVVQRAAPGSIVRRGGRGPHPAHAVFAAKEREFVHRNGAASRAAHGVLRAERHHGLLVAADDPIGSFRPRQDTHTSPNDVA